MAHRDRSMAARFWSIPVRWRAARTLAAVLVFSWPSTTAAAQQTGVTVHNPKPRPMPTFTPQRTFTLPLSPAIDRLERWVTALEGYLAGEFDPQFVEVTTWTRAEVMESAADVRTLASLAADPETVVVAQPLGTKARIRYRGDELTRMKRLASRASAWPASALLMRGAWFHTELAISGKDTQTRWRHLSQQSACSLEMSGNLLRARLSAVGHADEDAG